MCSGRFHKSRLSNKRVRAQNVHGLFYWYFSFLSTRKSHYGRLAVLFTVCTNSLGNFMPAYHSLYRVTFQASSLPRAQWHVAPQKFNRSIIIVTSINYAYCSQRSNGFYFCQRKGEMLTESDYCLT